MAGVQRRSSSVVPSGSARAAGQILVPAAGREHLALNVLKATGVFVVLLGNLQDLFLQGVRVDRPIEVHAFIGRSVSC